MERNKFGFGFRSNQSAGLGTSSGFNSNLSKASFTTSSSVSSSSASSPSLFGLISKVNKGILEQPLEPSSNVKKGILKLPTTGILKSSVSKEYGDQVNYGFNTFQTLEGYKQQNDSMDAKSKTDSVFKIPQSIPTMRHTKPGAQDPCSPLTGSNISASKGATSKVSLSGSFQGENKPRIISLVDYTDDDTGTETIDLPDSSHTATSYTEDKALKELDMYIAGCEYKSREHYKTDYDDREYRRQQDTGDDRYTSYDTDDHYYRSNEIGNSRGTSTEMGYSPSSQTDLHSGESHYHDYGKKRSTFTEDRRAEFGTDQSYKNREYYEDAYRGGTESYSEYDRRARDEKAEDYRYPGHSNTESYSNRPYTDRENRSYHRSDRPGMFDSSSSPYIESRDFYSGTNSGIDREHSDRYWETENSRIEDRREAVGTDSRRPYGMEDRDRNRTDNEWSSRTGYSESSGRYQYGSRGYDGERYDAYGSESDYYGYRYDSTKELRANMYDRGRSNDKDRFTVGKHDTQTDSTIGYGFQNSTGNPYRGIEFSDGNDSKQVYKSDDRKGSWIKRSENRSKAGQGKDSIMYEDYLFGNENLDDGVDENGEFGKDAMTGTKSHSTIMSARNSSIGQNRGLSSSAGREPGTTSAGFWCKDCNITCADQTVYDVHLHSNGHLLTLQRKAQELFQMQESTAGNTRSNLAGSADRRSRFNTSDMGQPLVFGAIQPGGVATTNRMTVTPPKPLGPLEAKTIRSTTLPLCWGKLTEDEEQLIDKYVIEYRNARETQWVTAGSTVKHEYAVHGLQENTDYLFRVSAVNGPEKSEFLESILITTAKRETQSNRRRSRSRERRSQRSRSSDRSGKDRSIENWKRATKAKHSTDKEVMKERPDNRTSSGSEKREETEECKLYSYFPKYSGSPLLGLEYVYEVVSYNPAIPSYYICKLCNRKEGLPEIMMKHISGLAHMLAFIKKHNSVLYDAIEMMPARRDKMVRLTEEAKFIEDRVGRGSLNVMKVLNPSDHGGKVVFTDAVPVKAPPPTRQKKSAAGTSSDTGANTAQEKQAPSESEFMKLYNAAVEADALPDKAIIGLSYVKEYIHPQNTELPMYVCTLCKCNPSHGTILFHLIGKKHRLKYIQQKYPDVYNTMSKKGNMKKELSQAASDIMEKSGIEKIKSFTAKNNQLWRDRKKDGDAGDKAKQENQDDNASAKSGEDGTKGIKFGLKKTDDQPASVKQSNVLEEDTGTQKSSQEILDWTKENETLQAKIKNQSIIKCCRKSKFIETYSTSFKQYRVIGMQWVTEFQKPDPKIEPWFMCFMCQQKLQWKDILSHVTSTAHRFNYLKTSHKDLSKSLYEKMGSSRLGVKHLVKEYTKKVIAIEGHPTELEVMIELSINTEALKSAMNIKDNPKSTAGLATTTTSTTATTIPSLLSLPVPGTDGSKANKILTDPQNTSTSSAVPKNQALSITQEGTIPSLLDLGLSVGTESQFSDSCTDPENSLLVAGKEKLGSENTASSSRIYNIIQQHAQKVLTEQILATGQFPSPGTVVSSEDLKHVGDNEQGLTDLTGNNNSLKSDSKLLDERRGNNSDNNKRSLSRDRDSISDKRFKREKSVDRSVSLSEKASNRSDDLESRSRLSDRSEDFGSRRRSRSPVSRAFSRIDERGLNRLRSDRSGEKDVGRDRGRHDDGRKRKGRYSREGSSNDVEDRESDRSQRLGRYARDSSVDRHRQSRSLSRDDERLRRGSRDKSRDREESRRRSRDRDRKGRYADSDRYESSRSPSDQRNRDQRRAGRDQIRGKSDWIVRRSQPGGRNETTKEQDYRIMEENDMLVEDEHAQNEDCEWQENLDDPSYMNETVEDQPENSFEDFNINVERTDRMNEEFFDNGRSEVIPRKYRGRGNVTQRNIRGRRGGRGGRGIGKPFNVPKFQATSNNQVDFGNTWADSPRDPSLTMHGFSSQELPSLLDDNMSRIGPPGLLQDQFYPEEEMHGHIGAQDFYQLEDDMPDPSPEEIEKLMRKAPNPMKDEIDQLMHRAKSLMEYIEVMDEEDQLANQPMAGNIAGVPHMQILPTGRGQMRGAPRGQFPDRGFQRGNRGMGRGFNNRRGQRTGPMPGRGGIQLMAFGGRGHFRGNR